MLADPIAARRRREALARLGVVDRIGDPALTALTRIASYVSGAAAAAVHIFDDDHQHRVAAVKAPLEPHPQEDSMCRLVVDAEQRIVCVDASQDPRFGYTSFVRGPDPVRFYASVPLRLGDGAVVGTLCTFDTVARELSEEQLGLLEDLAEQVASQIELTRIAVDLGHAASHDSLTGLVNRLVLTDRLAHALARKRRRGDDVLVVLLDVDNFKSINDTYGHAVGDQVLTAVAQRLIDSVRAEDTAARIGGDEFVIVAEVPHDGTGVAKIVARLEAAFTVPILYDGAVRPVGVSMGIALAEPGDDVRSALARADRAMYECKLGVSPTIR